MEEIKQVIKIFDEEPRVPLGPVIKCPFCRSFLLRGIMKRSSIKCRKCGKYIIVFDPKELDLKGKSK